MKMPGTMPNKKQLEILQANMLVQRLERLSVDSAWAHLASGYRGAILRCISSLEKDPGQAETNERDRLQTLVLKGFELLERAAVEMTETNPLNEKEEHLNG
jgi:hypothetical protein